MFATTGASTKELMSRGGWKSVAMVVRYEHASDERDALLAQELNRYAEGANVVSFDELSATRSRTQRATTRVKLKVRSPLHHR